MAFCKSSFAASPCKTLGYLGEIAIQTAQSRRSTKKLLQPTFRCQTVVHGAVTKGVPDCFFPFDRWFFFHRSKAAESLALVPVLCGRDEGPEGIHEERPSHSQMQCWDHRRTEVVPPDHSQSMAILTCQCFGQEGHADEWNAWLLLNGYNMLTAWLGLEQHWAGKLLQLFFPLHNLQDSKMLLLS